MGPAGGTWGARPKEALRQPLSLTSVVSAAEAKKQAQQLEDAVESMGARMVQQGRRPSARQAGASSAHMLTPQPSTMNTMGGQGLQYPQMLPVGMLPPPSMYGYLPVGHSAADTWVHGNPMLGGGALAEIARAQAQTAGMMSQMAGPSAPGQGKETLPDFLPEFPYVQGSRRDHPSSQPVKPVGIII